MRINYGKWKDRTPHLSLAAVGLSALLLNGCSTLATDSQPAATSAQTGPVIALVLGGGGAKGLAHVGVIKALEANHISPNLVVGTSVGSFVGSIYASGKPASDLESIAVTTADSDLTDFTVSYQGVIEGNKLRSFVNTQVNNKPIESFPIRFAAVAAEKHTLKKAVFTEGEAGLIVQASSSVPNVFIAPRIPDPKTSGQIGKKYIDGGVVSMIPVDAAKALGADIVIAVDLQAGKIAQSSTDTSTKSIWSLIEQGYNTYLSNSKNSNKSGPYTQNYEKINKAELARAEIVIRPEVSTISSISTLNREEAIAAGVKATEQQLPAIKAAIARAQANYDQQ